MALYHLGVSKEMSNVDTESSEEAKTCRVFYDTAVESVLKSFPWPFATVVADLGLVEEDPTNDWAFSYNYPSDCLTFLRIQNELRTDSRQSRLPYKVATDGSAKLIYTDIEDAICEYTRNVTDTSFYTADFNLGLSYFLASLMVPKLTRGDQYKILKDVMALYNMYINKAKANALNEGQVDQEVESEFIRSRE
jgi:hypothetical protein